MNTTIRNTLRLGAATMGALGLVAGALWFGLYDVSADTPHSRPVYAALEFARERSIAVRAARLSVPKLDDAERIRRGAGNYQAMCATCHLAPGVAPTELSRGLYPAPPNLSAQRVDAAAAFWTIKHGIKASGMPAWGSSMGDEHVWDLVAFLGKLPGLDAAGYRDLVARSGGHSHGGGETPAHDDADGHHHDDGDEHAAMPASKSADHPHAHGEHDHADPAHATEPAPHHATAEPPGPAESMPAAPVNAPAASSRKVDDGHSHSH